MRLRTAIATLGALALLGPAATASAADAPATPPAATTPAATTPADPTPPATGTTPTPTPTPTPPPRTRPFTVAAPSRAHGATIARIVAPTFARTDVDSAKHGYAVATETSWSHQAQTLLVLGATTRDRHDWVHVLLANRPDGSSGWVPRDDVVLEHTAYWIDVRTSKRQVTVFRGGKKLRAFRAVVGKPSTPTPLGLAAIYERDRQPNPNAFDGAWVLSLTALSNVLENFGGGPGRVGIHGRGGTSLLDPVGTARSHGCVRIDNANVAWIAARVTTGTPVLIQK